MKKLFWIAALWLGVSRLVWAEPLEVAAKAWLVLDYHSGVVLAQQNSDQALPPASLTKLMTAYLVFNALHEGKLSLNTRPPFSEYAAKALGERLPISAKEPATVEQLLQGMLTLSANDAAIQLAESVAGNEDKFVVLMNKRAAMLGLKNSRFENATGQPQIGHASSAHDVALLSAALIRDFPKEYAFFRNKSFTWLGRERPSQNLLLWRDASVDGLKTGTAGGSFNLAATASRGTRRVIAVVIGASSNEARAIEAQKLLNHGFLNFETPQVYAAGQRLTQLPVWQGVEAEVPVEIPRQVYVTVAAGSAGRIKAKLLSREHLIAPIQKGQTLGRVNLSLDGKTLAEIPVVAAKTVASSGWLGSTIDRIRWWWRK